MATMALTDPIVQPSRGSVEQVYAFAVEQEAQRLPFLQDYLDESWQLSEIDGFDFSEMSAQSAHETGNWAGKGFKSNANWTVLGNPAGLAITNSENKSLVYKNGRDAARAHHVHMWVYRYGPLKPGDALYEYRHLDGHYTEAATGTNTYRSDGREPYAGSVVTLADFNPNGQWALLLPYPQTGDRYGDRIVKKGREIWGNGLKVEDPPVEIPSTPEEPIPGGGDPMPNVYRRVKHPPFIDLPVSKPTGGGYGYTQIPTGSRRIVGVMNHETQGRGTGPWYRDFFSCPSGARCADALVDYLITRDGTIYRLNNPANNRSPWANGGPLGLEGDGPAFYARFGASGVNNSLISIEYEKLDHEDFTDAQVQSGGLLNAYWHDQDDQDWESYPYVPRYGCVTSLAHFEIGTTNCGKGELDDITRVQAVARGEMKRCQTQASGPAVPEVPEVPTQPEIPTLPGGISVAEATKRFGTLTKHTPDGKTKVAPFDPTGVISLSWLHRCVETGEWPRAEDWWALSDSGKTLDIITFSNEWQLIRTAERQGVMWAQFADAELEAVAA